MPSESLSTLLGRLEALAVDATPVWDELQWDGCLILWDVRGDKYSVGVRSEIGRFVRALDPETVRHLIAAVRAGEAMARLLGPWADVADAPDRGESATTPGLLTFAEQARSALTARRRATGGEDA